jgi:hypothetical protein
VKNYGSGPRRPDVRLPKRAKRADAGYLPGSVRHRQRRPAVSRLHRGIRYDGSPAAARPCWWWAAGTIRAANRTVAPTVSPTDLASRGARCRQGRSALAHPGDERNSTVVPPREPGRTDGSNAAGEAIQHQVDELPDRTIDSANSVSQFERRTNFDLGILAVAANPRILRRPRPPPQDVPETFAVSRAKCSSNRPLLVETTLWVLSLRNHEGRPLRPGNEDRSDKCVPLARSCPRSRRLRTFLARLP